MDKSYCIWCITPFLMTVKSYVARTILSWKCVMSEMFRHGVGHTCRVYF